MYYDCEAYFLLMLLWLLLYDVAWQFQEKHKMCNYDSGMLLIELAYSQHTYTYINIYLLIHSRLLCDLFYNFRHLTSFSTFMWSTQKRTIFNQIFERLMKQQRQRQRQEHQQQQQQQQNKQTSQQTACLTSNSKEKSMKK